MPSLHGQLVARVVSTATHYRTLFLIAALVIAGSAMAAPVELTVMTRNLYFGADTSAILGAPNAGAIPAAVKAAFAQAKANDFNLRVEGIADEIQQAQPQLIGLQEAVRINAVSTITGATTYSRDFVQILISELASRGLNYELAVTHTDFSSTLPSGNSFATLEELVTLTDRDVILRRSDVTVTGTKSATFVNDVSLPFAGGTFIFNRGYVAVDALVGGIPFRFVSTHLDELRTPLQALQLGEILTGNSDAQRLIVVGDFNSPADGSGTPTYAKALSAGLGDVWTELGAGLGFTCCENASLNNPTPLLASRIDYILHHGAILEPLAVELLGDTPFRIDAPLYASDHAGLVAIFAIDIAEPGILLLLGGAGVGWRCAARRRKPAVVAA
ncbi:MAG: endonuclease/exonuclease/phosphatase family protein [Burkholderiales bacterium]